MILPIYTFGNSVLRKIAEPIDQDYPGLKDLIKNMYDTMVHAEGVGLAAPQIGIPIRLIVIDLAPLKEDNPELGDFKVTMINPELLEESENEVEYDEGCLSIPGINETVSRPEAIKISYMDENFIEHVEVYDGYKARVVQHEYDHLEGHLFTDKIKPLRRQLIKGKLTNIVKGKANCKYKIK
ncbi:MAG TPA: peptide deformylase [Paludibacteraceae bacterium]|jgi:peptide deformylase|nr:peptide deformylase [Paludibacteraceae bacterium]